MKQVYLHIGLHKTGTTSIQKFLSNAEEELKKDGVLYPKSGRPDVPFDSQYGHHLLAWSIRGKNNINHYQDWEETLKEITKANQSIVVISSEDFERCNIKQIKLIYKILDEFNTHIVVYLRNPMDLMVSIYKQHIKSGKTTKKFGNFFETYIDRCKYFNLVKKWVDQFGRYNCHIKILDKYRTDYSVEQNFIELLGLKMENYFSYMNSPVNISPNNKQVALIRLINILENTTGIKFIGKKLRGNILGKRKVGKLLMALSAPLLNDNYNKIDKNGLIKEIDEHNLRLVDNLIDIEDWKYLKW